MGFGINGTVWLSIQVQQFYDYVQACVRNDGDYPKQFSMGKTGLCYGNTVQKSFFLSYSQTPFPVRYRFDGKLFNIMRLQAKTRVHEIPNEDDMAENTKTERKMHMAMNRVSEVCENCKFSISQVV